MINYALKTRQLTYFFLTLLSIFIILTPSLIQNSHADNTNPQIDRYIKQLASPNSEAVKAAINRLYQIGDSSELVLDALALAAERDNITYSGIYDSAQQTLKLLKYPEEKLAKLYLNRLYLLESFGWTESDLILAKKECLRELSQYTKYLTEADALKLIEHDSRFSQKLTQESVDLLSKIRPTSNVVSEYMKEISSTSSNEQIRGMARGYLIQIDYEAIGGGNSSYSGHTANSALLDSLVTSSLQDLNSTDLVKQERALDIILARMVLNVGPGITYENTSDANAKKIAEALADKLIAIEDPETNKLMRILHPSTVSLLPKDKMVPFLLEKTKNPRMCFYFKQLLLALERNSPRFSMLCPNSPQEKSLNQGKADLEVRRSGTWEEKFELAKRGGIEFTFSDLLREKELPSEIIEKIYSEESKDGRESDNDDQIARHANLPQSLRKVLLTNKNPNIRSTLAARTDNPIEIQHALVADKNSIVRMNLSMNKSLDTKVLQQLLHDDDPYVRNQAKQQLENRGISNSPEGNRQAEARTNSEDSARLDTLLNEAAATNDYKAISILIKNNNLTAVQIERIYKIASQLTGRSDTVDKPAIILSGVATHPNTSTGILQQLTKHNNYIVRCSVAKNETINLEIIRLLLESNDPNVKTCLLENKKLPTEIINELANDQEITVQNLAIQKLNLGR